MLPPLDWQLRHILALLVELSSKGSMGILIVSITEILQPQPLCQAISGSWKIKTVTLTYHGVLLIGVKPLIPLQEDVIYV